MTMQRAQVQSMRHVTLVVCRASLIPSEPALCSSPRPGLRAMCVRQTHFCRLIWVVVVTTGCGGRSDHTGQQDHLSGVTPVAGAAPNQPQSAETSPVTGTPKQLALPNQAVNTNEQQSSAVTADGDNEGIQKARAAGVPTSLVRMGDALYSTCPMVETTHHLPSTWVPMTTGTRGMVHPSHRI